MVVLPGRLMSCLGPDYKQPCPYIRISFANADFDQIREGIRCLGAILRGRLRPYQQGECASAPTVQGSPA